jgi:hypothetical protein
MARPVIYVCCVSARLSPCLFRLLAASGHQKLLQTAKHSAFQSASIKFVWTKTIQNQHKHIIGWVVVIVGIHYFLDPEPYEQLYLPPHVIVMILRFSHSQILPTSKFSEKLVRKKMNQTSPNRHGTTTYNENKGPRADQAKPGQLIDAVLADGIP